jgi:hypothetical protein
MKSRRSKNQQKLEASCVELAGFCLLWSLFNPEDGGNMFLRNVGNFSVYKPLDPSHHRDTFKTNADK